MVNIKSIQCTQKGFTLFEMLTVVFIIGIVISFATLSVGTPGSDKVEEEAKRIQQLLIIAGEEAIFNAKELALEINKQGYQFVVLVDGTQWQPIAGDKVLRKREFPEDSVVEVLIDDFNVILDDPDNPVRIFILSSGDVRPFILKIKHRDADDFFTLESDGFSRLTLLKPGQEKDENADST
jgi:general secretion pathway protein H